MGYGPRAGTLPQPVWLRCTRASQLSSRAIPAKALLQACRWCVWRWAMNARYKQCRQRSQQRRIHHQHSRQRRRGHQHNLLHRCGHHSNLQLPLLHPCRRRQLSLRDLMPRMRARIGMRRGSPNTFESCIEAIPTALYAGCSLRSTSCHLQSNSSLAGSLRSSLHSRLQIRLCSRHHSRLCSRLRSRLQSRLQSRLHAAKLAVLT